MKMFVIKIKREFESIDEAKGYMPFVINSENIDEFEIVELNLMEE